MLSVKVFALLRFNWTSNLQKTDINNAKVIVINNIPLIVMRIKTSETNK